MISRAASLHNFLRSVAAPERPQIDGSRVAVVVAHPDDETIGCGALLGRLSGVFVAVVTDGAPRNLQDAHWHGFSSAADYAAARGEELLTAMRLAGIAPEQLVQFAVPDQAAILDLTQITGRLWRFFESQRIGLAITHAYEGGHPDHDAVAFCVHRAARRSCPPLGIVEMPLYRATLTGDVRQSFPPAPDSKPVVVELTAAEQRRKRDMVAVYVTQEEVLAGFSTEAEYFRIAPEYDFAEAPNGGRILYDRENWGISSKDWLSHAREALAHQEALCA